MKFHGFFQDFSGFFQDFPRIFKSFLFFFFSQKSFFFFFFREKRIFFLEKKKKKKDLSRPVKKEIKKKNVKISIGREILLFGGRARREVCGNRKKIGAKKYSAIQLLYLLFDKLLE